MKNRILILIFFFFSAFNYFAQTTYFVKFKKDFGPKKSKLLLSEVLKKNNSQKLITEEIIEKEIISFIKKYGRLNNELDRLFEIKIATDNSHKILQELQNNSNVEYIQKANNYKIDLIPNDSLFSEQW